jgi:hypothetical protein
LSLRESCIRQIRLCSLGGGRRPAHRPPPRTRLCSLFLVKSRADLGRGDEEGGLPEIRVVKIVRWVMGHTKLFHHSARPRVCRHSEAEVMAIERPVI